MTPAQAADHPSFVVSPGPWGPTDEGQRAAACRFVRELLARCAPCGESAPVLAPAGLLAETITLDGRAICCFH